MSLDQHIAEFRADLAGCILTRAERAGLKAELEAALAQQARQPSRSLASSPEEGRAAA